MVGPALAEPRVNSIRKYVNQVVSFFKIFENYPGDATPPPPHHKKISIAVTPTSFKMKQFFL
jgi:hypothetical protein